MQIIPIDQDNNLFFVKDLFPQTLVGKILCTNWMALPWQRQEYQELWARRRIDNAALAWINEWDQICQQIWPAIGQIIGHEVLYQGTGWWLDEPGFTCSVHTDGEMPGAMQMTWIGNRELGTSFYHYNNLDSLRHQFAVSPNTGYIMINRPTVDGYRKLQWHAMLNPVPVDQYRVSSYSWIKII